MQMRQIIMWVHDFHLLKHIRASECDIVTVQTRARTMEYWTLEWLYSYYLLIDRMSIHASCSVGSSRGAVVASCWVNRCLGWPVLPFAPPVTFRWSVLLVIFPFPFPPSRRRSPFNNSVALLAGKTSFYTMKSHARYVMKSGVCLNAGKGLACVFLSWGTYHTSLQGYVPNEDLMYQISYPWLPVSSIFEDLA